MFSSLSLQACGFVSLLLDSNEDEDIAEIKLVRFVPVMGVSESLNSQNILDRPAFQGSTADDDLNAVILPAQCISATRLSIMQ